MAKSPARRDEGGRPWTNWALALFLVVDTTLYTFSAGLTAETIPWLIGSAVLAVWAIRRPAPKAVDEGPGAITLVALSYVLPTCFELGGAAEPPSAAIAVGVCAALLWLWTAWTLRGSFSLLPAQRKVIDRGPYRWLRHPMHFFSLLGVFAGVLWAPTAWNIGVSVALVAVLMVRARLEESVLSSSTEYSSYRARTPFMFIPWPPAEARGEEVHHAASG